MNSSSNKSIFDNKIARIIIAVVLSLIIWVLVTGQDSEEYRETFRGVRVVLSGEQNLRDSREMVVTDLSTSTVTVSVTGPRRIVAGLSSDDLIAQIDVSKLTQASYASLTYTITFPGGTDTSNITVSGKIPETVSFTVSKLNTKTVPVRGSFDGSLADGYTAESIVFEPDVITLTGPESYLKDISYAWVSFAADDVSTTYSEQTTYTLMTEDGEEAVAEGVTASDDMVTATLPILEIKDVALTVNLVYGSGATEENTIVTIEPSTIKFAGDSSILNGINKLTLATIDTTDFESTFSDTYTITYDESLTNIEGLTTADVTIEITGLETRVYTVTNIDFANITDGYSGKVETKSMEVRLRGTAEQLDQIKAENIRAVADLTDYMNTTGNMTVPAKIYIDGATEAGAVGDYTINLTITEAK